MDSGPLNTNGAGWSEENSQTFIDFGRYVVPEREAQIEIFGDLIPLQARTFHILELCCGEGLLAGALLARFSNCVLHGLDGSPAMLRQAQARLAPYGDRFTTRQFDLAASDWRQPGWPLHAVVSSLAIHHLDGAQKQALFRDVHRMLEPGDVFVVADIVQPAHALGNAAAAKAWDAAVRQRAVALDGDETRFALFEREQWNLFRYPDPDVDKPSRLLDQLKWLEQAGFADVDVYWMKAGHALFGGRCAHA